MGDLSRCGLWQTDRRVTMRKNKWMSLLICMGMCTGVMCACLTGCGKKETGDSAGRNQNTAADTASESEKSDGGQEGESDVMDENGDLNGQSAAKKAESDTEDAGEEAVSLEGLGISILGDSISTYDGWIPEGFNVFYPLSGDLTDVSQTWWMALVDETGMELCANNSSSGSTCVGDSLSIDDPSFGCSDGRISFLAGSQGRLPDIIIIYLGTNDLLTGIPIGDNDGTKLVEEGDIENFSDAYSLILDKMESCYPTAQIYCCSLPPIGDWGTDQPFIMFENHLGLTAVDYSDRIRMIAENRGAFIIDLDNCGIEIDNLQEMTTDGVHLTPVGMELVKTAVMRGLMDTAVR